MILEHIKCETQCEHIKNKKMQKSSNTKHLKS